MNAARGDRTRVLTENLLGYGVHSWSTGWAHERGREPNELVKWHDFKAISKIPGKMLVYWPRSDRTQKEGSGGRLPKFARG